MGRKPKQAPEIVRVAEILDIPLNSDVMSMNELADFPNLKNESNRNKLIIGATAAGYTQAAIGDALGVNQNTIWEIIHRIDPNGMFRLSKGAKAAYTLNLLNSRKLEALSHMTPAKLKECSAKELSGIAKDMVMMTQNLTQSKHGAKGASKISMLMDAIEIERQNDEIEDAEIIEES
jgi:hypothetical protein